MKVRKGGGLTPMWREAVLAALVLHLLTQGSQIPIGVKSHMLGLGGAVARSSGGGGSPNKLSKMKCFRSRSEAYYKYF